MTREQRIVMAVLTFLGASYVYSTTIMAPLLLQLAAQFGVSAGTAGLTSAAYGVPTIVLGMLVGPYSDRYGRKRFLVSGALLLAASTLAAALAPTFALVVASRFCGGIGAALLGSSMTAALADAVPYRQRGGAIAIVSTGGNLFAFVVGLPLAGIVAEATSRRVSLAMLAALIVVGAAANARWIPPSHASATVAGVRRLYRLALGDRSALLLLAAALLAGFAWTGWSGYVVVFFQRTFELPQGIASIFTITTGVGFFVGGQIGGRTGDRFGNRSVGIAVLVVAAAAYAAMTQAALPIAAAAALNVVLIALIAARVVTIQVMLSEQVPAARGTLMAIFGSVNAAAAAGGVALAGLAIDIGGFGLFGIVCVILVTTAAALLVFVHERAAVDHDDAVAARAGTLTGAK